jgi:hypothetical protein
MHEPVASSHVSRPLHITPSEQLRGVPAHTPAEQMSPAVQKCPSSQRVPSSLLNAVVERVGSHTRHALVGSSCPAPKQLPPITQPLHVATHASVARSQIITPVHVGVPATHACIDSLHVSSPSHAMPSEQLRAVPWQAVPVQLSPVVQYMPSSQAAPEFGDQSVADTDMWQTSHWFAGLRIPFGMHAPRIMQPPGHVSAAFVSRDASLPVSDPASRPASIATDPSFAVASRAAPSLGVTPVGSEQPTTSASPMDPAQTRRFMRSPSDCETTKPRIEA